MSDLDRLRKRLTRARRPIPMPTLRVEFPGGLTQRISELKALGVRVKNLTTWVGRKRHSVYFIES